MRIRFKVWIEKDSKFLLGKGGYEILKAIDRFGSVSEASKSLGMSYKFVWSYIRRIESVLGEKVVEMKRGKGGGAYLTPLGKSLVETYEVVEDMINSALIELGCSCGEGCVKIDREMISLISGCI